MNNLKLWGCLSAMTLFLSGCGDDTIVSGGTGQGKLALDVKVTTEIISSTTVTSSRADDGGMEAEDITRDNLTLAITSKETGGTALYNLSTFDSSIQFPTGTYTIEAYYGDEENEGFGNPYYYGVADNVVVKKDTTTPVSLNAELKSAMFTITYTENLQNYLTQYCAYLQSATGKEAIAYPADATRRVYMKPGKVDINLSFTKPNGMEGNIKVVTVDAMARKHYGVTLDVEGNISSNTATLTVKFDDAVDDAETIEINLDDAALAIPAPAVTLTGYTPGVEITHTEGAKYSNDLLYYIYAPGKLKNVNLVTTFTNNASIEGWSENIDLLTADAATQAKLQDLGLSARGVWRNPDEIAELNLKDVIQNIKLLNNKTTQADFTVTVVDKNGKSSEPQTLSLTIEPFIVEQVISNATPSTLALGENQITMDVKYNGLSIADNLTVQYNDIFGTWYDATAVFSAVEGQEEQYTAVVTDLPTSGKFELRTKYTTGETSNELSIERTYPEIELTIDEADVWTNRATFTVKAKDGTSVLKWVESTYAVKISNNGTDYRYYTHKSLSGDQIELTNLTPGLKYYVKVTLSGEETDLSDALEFSTEAETQLPNANMDTWYTVAGATQYWWVEYPGADTNAAWGTMNLLTTSIGGSDTGALSTKRNGCSYCAYSGTRATTDSKSGNAAIIETVGWGVGNTAAGTGASICKNVTAGELYLGTYDSSTQSPNYNYAFASRPTSLTFWYKYRAKNSADYGTAEITVLNADGTAIATYSMQLSNTDAYTQATLPLNYTIKAKATSIRVIFKSSGNSECIKWNTSYMDGPDFGAKDGRFVGSSLYIDDITLNY